MDGCQPFGETIAREEQLRWHPTQFFTLHPKIKCNPWVSIQLLCRENSISLPSTTFKCFLLCTTSFACFMSTERNQEGREAGRQGLGFKLTLCESEPVALETSSLVESISWPKLFHRKCCHCSIVRCMRNFTIRHLGCFVESQKRDARTSFYFHWNRITRQRHQFLFAGSGFYKVGEMFASDAHFYLFLYVAFVFRYVIAHCCCVHCFYNYFFAVWRRFAIIDLLWALKCIKTYSFGFVSLHIEVLLVVFARKSSSLPWVLCCFVECDASL